MLGIFGSGLLTATPFQWLFDDRESYQNRLIPDKADQRSWLARVGQIVKEHGGRWTPNGCEED